MAPLIICDDTISYVIIETGIERAGGGVGEEKCKLERGGELGVIIYLPAMPLSCITYPTLKL